MEIFSDKELNEWCQKMYDYRKSKQQEEHIYDFESQMLAMKIAHCVCALFTKKIKYFKKTRAEVHELVDQLGNNDLITFNGQLKYLDKTNA